MTSQAGIAYTLYNAIENIICLSNIFFGYTFKCVLNYELFSL